MKFILINGKKRSGKDFFAKALQMELYKKGKTSKIIAFADPIKEIIATSLTIDLNTLDRYKNNHEPVFIQGKQVTNVRSIIQHFGTEAMQNQFGKDVWVNILIEKANKLNVDYVLVPDFRFIKEYIQGSITVKIRNDDIDKKYVDSHISENELNDFEFEYVIDNTGYKNLTPAILNFIANIL